LVPALDEDETGIHLNHFFIPKFYLYLQFYCFLLGRFNFLLVTVGRKLLLEKSNSNYVVFPPGIFAICLLAVNCLADRTVDHHLTDNDFKRFQKVFADGLKSDLQSIYYSAKNSKDSPAKDKQEVCSRLVSVHKDSKLNVRQNSDSFC
jgi:Oligosaccharyltransferase subunit Ribophorin II